MNCHKMETTKEPNYNFPIQFHNPCHYCMMMLRKKKKLLPWVRFYH